MLRRRPDRNGWQVVVEAGPDPSTGRRRRKTTLVRGSKREARQVELRLLADLERTGTLAADGAKLTVRAYLAHWLEIMRSRVAPLTWRSYEAKLRVHVLPTLGGTRLNRLHAFDLERLYEALSARGLSPLMVHHVHATLSGALRHAVRYELIPRSPCDLVVVGRGARREMDALDADAARGLLAACERQDSIAADAVALMLLTGLRLGEALGLKWSAIDQERGIINVMATRQRQTGLGLVERPPKTASSRRAVACGPYAVAVLGRLRARQTVVNIGDGLVFEGLTDVTLRRALRTLLEGAMLPRIRLHDLRHSWASLFGSWGGADLKTASAHLGHSSIAVTADVYTHVPPAIQRKAIQGFELWLVGGEKGAQMAHSE
jgi:integrase